MIHSQASEWASYYIQQHYFLDQNGWHLVVLWKNFKYKEGGFQLVGKNYEFQAKES